jgi:hypothetical protein
MANITEQTHVANVFTADSMPQIAAALQNRTTSVVSTASYTLALTDHLVAIDASGGDRTLTLLDAVANPGLMYFVQRIDNTLANAAIVQPTAGLGQTINGVASLAFTAQFKAMLIYSQGGQWYAIIF